MKKHYCLEGQLQVITITDTYKNNLAALGWETWCIISVQIFQRRLKIGYLVKIVE